MTSNELITVPINEINCLRHALESMDASYDEMDEAVGTLTRLMDKLMRTREKILVRMRATGRLK
jgi:hypothetical protein